VVTSALGSLRSCRARSALGVSPLRQCQRALGVGRQRAHRRQPQHRQRRRRAACHRHATGLAGTQRAQPHGIGLAGTGGRMQQPAAAFGHGLPHSLLEREGRPAAAGEPVGGGTGELHRLIIEAARTGAMQATPRWEGA
jgi:hypothetical protein